MEEWQGFTWKKLGTWFECSTIIQIKRDGTVVILQVQSIVNIERLISDNGVPTKTGIYQWRPISRQWYSDGKASFWTQRYGWGSLMAEEPWGIDLPKEKKG